MKKVKIFIFGSFFIFGVFSISEVKADINPPKKWEGRWAYCHGDIVYECENVGVDCIDQWCCGD